MGLQVKQGVGNKVGEQIWVVFSLAGEKYAAPISHIREVIKIPEIIKIPESLDFVEGVVNIRGSVIPVIDLKFRLKLGKADGDRNSRVMIVDVGGVQAGLIVDHVSEVMRIHHQYIQPTPTMTCRVDAHYIFGVANMGGNMIILLDLVHVFSEEQQGMLAEATYNQGGEL
ncbi:MAG: chemotaxis protein CheW [Bacillota bacterium]|nr:chemotaxis protein CheW [Bacillota bacterium]MDW7683034.1 chemotaxis protein CheW [Bacillota bacterium]